MNRTRTTGFYGTRTDTYYVRDNGDVWVIQTEDLRDCPFRLNGDIPADATECSDLLSPDEMNDFVEAVEAVEAE